MVSNQIRVDVAGNQELRYEAVFKFGRLKSTFNPDLIGKAGIKVGSKSADQIGHIAGELDPEASALFK